MTKILIRLCLLITLTLPAFAVSDPAYRREVVLEGIHDPPVNATLESGITYKLDYTWNAATQEAAPESIGTPLYPDWEDGQKLYLEYSKKHGLTLRDEESNYHMRVIDYWDTAGHPLADILDEIVENNHTNSGTAGMGSGLMTRRDIWLREIERHYDRLADVFPDQAESIRKARKQWEENLEAQEQMFFDIYGSKAGTIQGIHAGARRLDLVRSHAEILEEVGVE